MVIHTYIENDIRFKTAEPARAWADTFAIYSSTVDHKCIINTGMNKPPPLNNQLTNNAM